MSEVPLKTSVPYSVTGPLACCMGKIGVSSLDKVSFGSLCFSTAVQDLLLKTRVRNPRGGRALPTEKKVERGTSQSKGGTSINLNNSGDLAWTAGLLDDDIFRLLGLLI